MLFSRAFNRDEWWRRYLAAQCENSGRGREMPRQYVLLRATQTSGQLDVDEDYASNLLITSFYFFPCIVALERRPPEMHYNNGICTLALPTMSHLWNACVASLKNLLRFCNKDTNYLFFTNLIMVATDQKTGKTRKSQGNWNWSWKPGKVRGKCKKVWNLKICSQFP